MIYAKWIEQDGRFAFSIEDNGGVQITQEEHAALLDGQTAGHVIVAGEDGRPVLQDAPPPAPFVPDRVTMRQARLALLGAGLLDDVEAALAALEGTAGQAARIEWEYSQEVWRNKPFVQQVAGAIGMSDEQLDQLFITAAGIEW